MQGRKAFLLSKPLSYHFDDSPLSPDSQLCPRRNKSQPRTHHKTLFFQQVANNCFLICGTSKLEMLQACQTKHGFQLVLLNSIQVGFLVQRVLVQRKQGMTLIQGSQQMRLLHFNKQQKVFYASISAYSPRFYNLQFLDNNFLIGSTPGQILLIDTKSLKVSKRKSFCAQQIKLLTNGDGWCILLYKNRQTAYVRKVTVNEKAIQLGCEQQLCKNEQADILLSQQGVLTFVDKQSFFANYKDQIVLFKKLFGKFKPYDSLMLRNRKGNLKLMENFILVAIQRQVFLFSLDNTSGKKFQIKPFDYLVNQHIPSTASKVMSLVLKDTVLFLWYNQKRCEIELNHLLDINVQLKLQRLILEDKSTVGQMEVFCHNMGLPKRLIYINFWNYSKQTHEDILKYILPVQDYRLLRKTVKIFLKTKSIPVSALLDIFGRLRPSGLSDHLELKQTLKADMLISKLQLLREPQQCFDFKQYRSLVGKNVFDMLSASLQNRSSLSETICSKFKLLLLQNYRQLAGMLSSHDSLCHILSNPCSLISQNSILWQPIQREQYQSYPNQQLFLNPNFVQVTRQFKLCQWFKWHALIKHRFLSLSFTQLCELQSAVRAELVFYYLIEGIYKSKDLTRQLRAIELLQIYYQLPSHLKGRVRFYKDYYDLITAKFTNIKIDFVSLLSTSEHALLQLVFDKGHRDSVFSHLAQLYSTHSLQHFALVFAAFFKAYGGRQSQLIFLLRQVSMQQYSQMRERILPALIGAIKSQTRVNNLREIEMVLNYASTIQLDQGLLQELQSIVEAKDLSNFFQIFQVQLTYQQVSQQGIDLLSTLMDKYLLSQKLTPIQIGEEQICTQKPINFLNILLLVRETLMRETTQQSVVRLFLTKMLQYDEVQVTRFMVYEEKVLEQYEISNSQFQELVILLVKDILAIPNKNCQDAYHVIARLMQFLTLKHLERRKIKASLKLYQELKMLHEDVELPPQPLPHYVQSIVSKIVDLQKLELAQPQKISKHLIKMRTLTTDKVRFQLNEELAILIKVYNIFIMRMVQLSHWEQAYALMNNLFKKALDRNCSICFAYYLSQWLPLVQRQYLGQVILKYFDRPMELSNFCIKVIRQLQTDARKKILTDQIGDSVFQSKNLVNFIIDSSQPDLHTKLKAIYSRIRKETLVGQHQLTCVFYWLVFSNPLHAMELMVNLQELFSFQSLELLFHGLVGSGLVEGIELSIFFLKCLVATGRAYFSEVGIDVQSYFKLSENEVLEDNKKQIQELRQKLIKAYEHRLSDTILFFWKFIREEKNNRLEVNSNNTNFVTSRVLEERKKELVVTSGIRQSKQAIVRRRQRRLLTKSSQVSVSKKYQSQKINYLAVSRPAEVYKFNSGQGEQMQYAVSPTCSEVMDNVTFSNYYNRFKGTGSDRSLRSHSDLIIQTQTQGEQKLNRLDHLNTLVREIKEFNNLREKADPVQDYKLVFNQRDSPARESCLPETHQAAEKESVSQGRKEQQRDFVKTIMQVQENSELHQTVRQVQTQILREDQQSNELQRAILQFHRQTDQQQRPFTHSQPNDSRKQKQLSQSNQQLAQQQAQQQSKLQEQQQAQQHAQQQEQQQVEQQEQQQGQQHLVQAQQQVVQQAQQQVVQQGLQQGHQQGEQLAQQQGQQIAAQQEGQQQQGGQQRVSQGGDQKGSMQVQQQPKREQIFYRKEDFQMMLNKFGASYIQQKIEQILQNNAQTVQQDQFLKALFSFLYLKFTFKRFLQLVESFKAINQRFSKITEGRCIRMMQLINKNQSQSLVKQLIPHQFIFWKSKCTNIEKFNKETFKRQKSLIKSYLDETNVFSISKLVCVLYNMEKNYEQRVQFYYIEDLIQKFRAQDRAEQISRLHEKMQALASKLGLPFLTKKLAKLKKKGFSLHGLSGLQRTLLKKAQVSKQDVRQINQLFQ